MEQDFRELTKRFAEGELPAECWPDYAERFIQHSFVIDGELLDPSTGQISIEFRTHPDVELPFIHACFSLEDYQALPEDSRQPAFQFMGKGILQLPCRKKFTLVLSMGEETLAISYRQLLILNFHRLCQGESRPRRAPDISVPLLKKLQKEVSGYCATHQDILRCWICLVDLQADLVMVGVVLDSFRAPEHELPLWDIVQRLMGPGLLLFILDPEDARFQEIQGRLRRMPPIYDAVKPLGLFAKLRRAFRVQPIPYITFSGAD